MGALFAFVCMRVCVCESVLPVVLILIFVAAAAVVAAGSDVDVGYCCALFLLIAGRGKGSFC